LLSVFIFFLNKLCKKTGAPKFLSFLGLNVI